MSFAVDLQTHVIVKDWRILYNVIVNIVRMKIDGSRPNVNTIPSGYDTTWS